MEKTTESACRKCCNVNVNDVGYIGIDPMNDSHKIHLLTNDK